MIGGPWWWWGAAVLRLARAGGCRRGKSGSSQRGSGCYPLPSPMKARLGARKISMTWKGQINPPEPNSLRPGEEGWGALEREGRSPTHFCPQN